MTAAAPPAAGQAVDPGAGWSAALSTLVAVPAGHRTEVMDRPAALEMLRCPDATLDTLVAGGLPCSGPPGAERFDRYDLFNLALYSGSGRSVPEIAIRFALRWMSGPPQSWFAPADWTVRIELDCALPHAGRGQDQASWRIARPVPEAAGGETLALGCEHPDAVVGPRDVTATGPAGLTLAATVRTRGRPDRLLSRPVLAAVEDFRQAGYRWVRLPEALQRHPEQVLPHGVAPCISACLRLERTLRDSGVRARSRRGWILGMLDLAHAWVEIVDDDGRVKTVDPIFELLSAHAPDPHPAFAAACAGSTLNRLLPSDHDAAGELTAHRCGGADREPARRTTIRSVRTAGGAGTVRTARGAGTVGTAGGCGQPPGRGTA